MIKREDIEIFTVECDDKKHHILKCFIKLSSDAYFANSEERENLEIQIKNEYVTALYGKTYNQIVKTIKNLEYLGLSIESNELRKLAKEIERLYK